MEIDDYTDKVWSFLDKLKPGDKIPVKRIVKTSNQVKFIQAVKDYIDTWGHGMGIGFSSDYSHIKKIQTF